MFCPKCGKEIPDSSKFCEFCGAPTGNAPIGGEPRPASADPNASPYKRLVALLLCYFLGILGVHRFYVGKSGTGIAMIFTLGGLGIWALIDIIMIVCGTFKDKDGKCVTTWW